MAIAQFATGASLDDYQRSQTRIAADNIPIPGRILQVCWGDPDDLRILNVWESQEACDSFTQSVLLPLMDELGLGNRELDIVTSPVHKVNIAPREAL